MNTNTSHYKIAIVAAKFNQAIVAGLCKGAEKALIKQGVEIAQISQYHVPGAVEIPLICQDIARHHNVDGIITLGAVIRGETAHFDYVAGECARGITRVSLDEHLPISFGVLATNTLEQAIARSGDNLHNKGGEAAEALLEILCLRAEMTASLSKHDVTSRVKS